jgi:hypothetical protein
MPIDDTLLGRAIEARNRSEEMKREAVLARSTFHEAVCDLHRAGASLREIAEALDLSHQRVHQIVEPAGAGRWMSWLGRRPGAAARPRQPAACAVCARDRHTVRKLIAGPGLYICDDCVALGRRVVAAGAAVSDDNASLELARGDARCDFCGKGSRQLDGPIVTGGHRPCFICVTCLDLCDEVLQRERGG